MKNVYGLPPIFFFLFTCCLLGLATVKKPEVQNYYKVTFDDSIAIVTDPINGKVLMSFDTSTVFYQTLIKDNE